MQRKHMIRLLLLCLLITVGIILQISGALEPAWLITMARQYADHWWLILILILLQVSLFTFALAGSLFLWVAATLYPPLISTFILVSGGTLGGITAYYFSRRLTDEWIHKIETSAIYKLLQKEDNFFTLFAMRVMPAFPHALINYTSGILNINIGYFIAATVLGLTVKCYIFSKVIYQASSSASLNDLLDISTYGPLLFISVAIFVVAFIKYRKRPE